MGGWYRFVSVMIHYDDVKQKGRRKISNEVIIGIYHIINMCNEDRKDAK